MMNLNNKIIRKIDNIVEQGRQSLLLGERNRYNVLEADAAKFIAFRSSGLSFILKLFEIDHPYYNGFHNILRTYRYEKNINGAIEILLNIKSEVEEGWLHSIRDIVSSELFADFMEMAEYLLKEGYKDPGAVITGSVLEEHMRQLCIKNSIATELIKDNKSIPKKADLLNSELTSANVYNKLDQKNVTAWLDLRNKAAHGKYEEYTKEQVQLMYQGITDFIARTT